MKNLLITVLVLMLTTLFANVAIAQQPATCSSTINVGSIYQPKEAIIPAEIETIFSTAANVERIGVLPNGDAIFLATGISDIKGDTSRWSLSRVLGVNRRYLTRSTEYLFAKLKRTNEWVLLTGPPTYNCTITEAYLTKDWEIAVTLLITTSKEKVFSFYSMSEDDYFFQSKEDAERIVNIPMVTFE